MKLSQLAQGRDNNFNLIRILAALAVLVSHSYPLALGPHSVEPLANWLGMSFGTVAVDAFFITSGFLVTGSLLTRSNALEFFWARAMRVFPGLIAMLLLTVLVLGPLLTSKPLLAYFTDRSTFLYLARGATLFRDVAYLLPGVFEHNPYPGAVNGSLWTLPIEVRLYALLGVLWLLLGLFRLHRRMLFAIASVTLAVVAGALVVTTHLQGQRDSDALRLLFMFFTGSAFFCLRERITISRRVFWILAVGLAASTIEVRVFYVLYMATLAYLLLYLAYGPEGRLRRYNRLGDYSYGVYIYAFPLQQIIVFLFPGINVPALALLAGLCTLALAVASWHLVERPALKLKDRWFRPSTLVAPA